MLYKITAPEKNYKGVTSGIVFTKGEAIAELDVFSLEWFKEKGYTVEKTGKPNEKLKKEKTETTGKVETPEAGATGEQNTETPEDGDEKTKADLLEEAKALGIENIRSKATKAEIEKLINDKRIELEALESEGNSNNEDPEAGATGDEDPEKGE